MCALKLIDLKARAGDNINGGGIEELRCLLQREVSIHSTLTHANVVPFIESFEYNNETRMMAIALQYCSGGDLGSYFARVRDSRKSAPNAKKLTKERTFLTHDEIRHATSHLLDGLAYLHSIGVVHRDIKGANIYLVPRGNHNMQPIDGKRCATTTIEPLLSFTLKIGDFGLAVRMDEDEDWDECRMTVCGTPSCLAPEVVRGCGGNDGLSAHSHQLSMQGYGQPADLWSTGCLLYTMIVGRNPFALPASNKYTTKEEKMVRVAATIDRVSREDWSIPAHVTVSADAEALLNQLLESIPRKRGSAKHILDSHPFFRDTSSDQSPGSLMPVCEKENVENCNRGPSTANKIFPMDNLHRLQPNKYQWIEGHRQFAAFLLGHHGIVIREQKSERVRRWMHITCDGQGVFCATMAELSSNTLTNTSTNNVLSEAFKYTPSGFSYHGGSHKPLSSLLWSSNKRNLRLYKVAEKLVQSVRLSTPKITLQLYSTTSNNPRLIAKVMLMENGPNADFEAAFVEGTSFHIRNRHQEICQIGIHSQSCDSTVECRRDKSMICNLEELISAGTNVETRTALRKLSNHFTIVQSALQECLRIEQTEDNYPISMKMAVDSSDRSKWTILDDD